VETPLGVKQSNLYQYNGPMKRTITVTFKTQINTNTLLAPPPPEYTPQLPAAAWLDTGPSPVG